jgi:hypothetical protein
MQNPIGAMRAFSRLGHSGVRVGRSGADPRDVGLHRAGPLLPESQARHWWSSRCREGRIPLAIGPSRCWSCVGYSVRWQPEWVIGCAKIPDLNRFATRTDSSPQGQGAGVVGGARCVARQNLVGDHPPRPQRFGVFLSTTEKKGWVSDSA